MRGDLAEDQGLTSSQLIFKGIYCDLGFSELTLKDRSDRFVEHIVPEAYEDEPVHRRTHSAGIYTGPKSYRQWADRRSCRTGPRKGYVSFLSFSFALPLMPLTDAYPRFCSPDMTTMLKLSGLFIEPRNAQVLSDSRLLAIWGERPSILTNGTAETIDSAGGNSDGKSDPVV